MKKSRGMTLLEVLISLLIVSVALFGLARSGALSLDAHHQVAQRTWALMVADNVLTDIRLEGVAAPGRRQGEMRMADQSWVWQAVIGPSPDPAMWRVDVGVYAPGDEDDALVMHTGFVAP